MEYYYKKNIKKIYFINNINACEKNVNSLKNRLSHLGYKCCDLKVKCINDLEKKIEIEKEEEGNVMVFFYGYGYDRDTIFLGSNAQECITYETLYRFLQQMLQGEEEALMLFTTTWWKAKTTTTTTITSSYDSDDTLIENIFHLTTLVNGKSDNGCLMTEYLLNLDWGKETSCMKFSKLAQQICVNVNRQKEWKDGKYYSYRIFLGTYDDVIVPKF